MATPKYLECNLSGNQQPYEPFLDLYPADGTPLWLSQRFAPGLGLDSFYIKEECYAPTSSFKNRQASGAIAATLENGIEEVNEGQEQGGGK